MRQFVALMGVREGMSILDLGGHPKIWDAVRVPLRITVLNLPGAIQAPPASHHRIRYLDGDACKVQAFRDREFDVVFSNSVIEHVGPHDKQAEFAREVRRLGRSYWVQTPSKWFPVEAHCGMPFWWFYPKALREYLINRWRRKLPAWTAMIEDTRVLTEAELRQLFPEASMLVETVIGIAKSYVAYFIG